jgi:hypothetical protein
MDIYRAIVLAAALSRMEWADGAGETAPGGAGSDECPRPDGGANERGESPAPFFVTPATDEAGRVG